MTGIGANMGGRPTADVDPTTAKNLEQSKIRTLINFVFESFKNLSKDELKAVVKQLKKAHSVIVEDPKIVGKNIGELKRIVAETMQSNSESPATNATVALILCFILFFGKKNFLGYFKKLGPDEVYAELGNRFKEADTQDELDICSEIMNGLNELKSCVKEEGKPVEATHKQMAKLQKSLDASRGRMKEFNQHKNSIEQIQTPEDLEQCKKKLAPIQTLSPSGQTISQVNPHGFTTNQMMQLKQLRKDAENRIAFKEAKNSIEKIEDEKELKKFSDVFKNKSYKFNGEKINFSDAQIEELKKYYEKAHNRIVFEKFKKSIENSQDLNDLGLCKTALQDGKGYMGKAIKFTPEQMHRLNEYVKAAEDRMKAEIGVDSIRSMGMCPSAAAAG